MKYTELEIRCYNCLVEEMMSNGIFDAIDLAEAINLPINSVKGVLGSLSKKNLVECEGAENFRQSVIWPIHRISGDIGFWGDMMTKNEIAAAFINE